MVSARVIFPLMFCASWSVFLFLHSEGFQRPKYPNGAQGRHLGNGFWDMVELLIPISLLGEVLGKVYSSDHGAKYAWKEPLEVEKFPHGGIGSLLSRPPTSLAEIRGRVMAESRAWLENCI